MAFDDSCWTSRRRRCRRRLTRNEVLRGDREKSGNFDVRIDLQRRSEFGILDPRRSFRRIISDGSDRSERIFVQLLRQFLERTFDRMERNVSRRRISRIRRENRFPIRRFVIVDGWPDVVEAVAGRIRRRAALQDEQIPVGQINLFRIQPAQVVARLKRPKGIRGRGCQRPARRRRALQDFLDESVRRVRMTNVQKFHSLEFVLVEAEVRDFFEVLVVEVPGSGRRSLAPDRPRGLERVVLIPLKSYDDPPKSAMITCLILSGIQTWVGDFCPLDVLLIVWHHFEPPTLLLKQII